MPCTLQRYQCILLGYADSVLFVMPIRRQSVRPQKWGRIFVCKFVCNFLFSAMNFLYLQSFSIMGNLEPVERQRKEREPLKINSSRSGISQQYRCQSRPSQNEAQCGGVQNRPSGRRSFCAVQAFSPLVKTLAQGEFTSPEHSNTKG